jgi:hypothetical protein
MGGKKSKPKAPPVAPPPPTETSLDVQQEMEGSKRKAKNRAGRASTVLTEQVNSSTAGGNTVLG